MTKKIFKITAKSSSNPAEEISAIIILLDPNFESEIWDLTEVDGVISIEEITSEKELVQSE